MIQRIVALMYVTPLSRATEWDVVKPLIILLLISIVTISEIYLTPAVVYYISGPIFNL